MSITSLQAIRRAAAAVEQRSEFVAQALKARTQMLETGQGHDADDVHAYLRERVGNKTAPTPALKPWRK
jgi:hypothetical protein